MKMTKEHYSVLKEQIFNAVSTNELNLNNKEFAEKWDKIYTDYTEGRKLWDLYWKSGGNDWKEVVFNNCYDHTYTDKHLLTAIKKVYKELGK